MEQAEHISLTVGSVLLQSGWGGWWGKNTCVQTAGGQTFGFPEKLRMKLSSCINFSNNTPVGCNYHNPVRQMLDKYQNITVLDDTYNSAT